MNTCMVELLIPAVKGDKLRATLGRIHGRWGGITISEAKGLWTDGDGNVHRDKLSVVRASILEWNQEAFGWWELEALHIKRDFNQDCIMLTVFKADTMFIGLENYKLDDYRPKGE